MLAIKIVVIFVFTAAALTAIASVIGGRRYH
jgi:hypothetical protein